MTLYVIGIVRENISHFARPILFPTFFAKKLFESQLNYTLTIPDSTHELVKQEGGCLVNGQCVYAIYVLDNNKTRVKYVREFFVHGYE